MRVKVPEEFYNILNVMGILSNDILRKLDDYENQIISNSSTKQQFYNIEYVYMHSTVLDLAKLLAVTKSDKSGLRQLMDISPEKYAEKISAFQVEYESIIAKIKDNRNRIISHVDISSDRAYFMMGVSESETEKKIADYLGAQKYYRENPVARIKVVEGLRSLQSLGRVNEKYGPTDFVGDFPVFKKMITEIGEILHDLNMYYYENSLK